MKYLKAIIIVHNNQPYLFTHTPWKILRSYLRRFNIKYQPQSCSIPIKPPNTQIFRIQNTIFLVGLQRFALNYYFSICKYFEAKPYLPNSLTKQFTYVPQYGEEQFV